MADSITRKNIDLDILDYYDGKIKNYVDDKVGTGSLTIDNTLSDTSTNPVQNKIVKQAIDSKADKSLYGDTTINVGRKAGTTVGVYSTAEGYNTTASGTASHAEGKSTIASGLYSHAEGSNCNSKGGESPDLIVAISDVDYTITGSTAYGINSHAEGTQTFAYGYSSHAEGGGTTASGSLSHAEGYNTTASGDSSHAEGESTTASGVGSHAEGESTTASGVGSHAEGYNTTASKTASHAEGAATTASGSNAHAEGGNTTASGDNSHAEGNSNYKVTQLITDFSGDSTTNDDIINAWNTKKFSVARGKSSHVEGQNNLSLGHYSHAEGLCTVAIGNQSHTSGYYTKALHDNEAAYGKYNESNDNTLFSIGDGTADDARHNAFEITTTGGKLHDKDIATTDLIPTSLPANGGNADTVDGYHVDNLIHASGSIPPEYITEFLRINDDTKSIERWNTGNLKVAFANNAAKAENADTVGGKSANNFTQIIDFGFTETDTKTAIGQPGKTAIYRCSKWTDYPSGCYDGQGTVIAINYNGAGTAGVNTMWVRQIFITPHGSSRSPIYMRCISDTTVGKWEEISTTPIKSTTVSGTTDANGNLMLWAASENKIPICAILTVYFSSIFYYSPNGNYYLGVTDINTHAYSPNVSVGGTVYYIEQGVKL